MKKKKWFLGLSQLNDTKEMAIYYEDYGSILNLNWLWTHS